MPPPKPTLLRCARQRGSFCAATLPHRVGECPLPNPPLSVARDSAGRSARRRCLTAWANAPSQTHPFALRATARVVLRGDLPRARGEYTCPLARRQNLRVVPAKPV